MNEINFNDFREFKNSHFCDFGDSDDDEYAYISCFICDNYNKWLLLVLFATSFVKYIRFVAFLQLLINKYLQCCNLITLFSCVIGWGLVPVIVPYRRPGKGLFGCFRSSHTMFLLVAIPPSSSSYKFMFVGFLHR